MRSRPGVGIRRLVAGAPRRQSGVALLALLTLIALTGMYQLLRQLNSVPNWVAREERAARALAEAKDALLGEAISAPEIVDAGYLLLPDAGVWFGAPKEGYASGTPVGASRDYSLAGKTPWRSLKIPPPRDRSSECLWYVLSGRFRNDVRTPVFNWDTVGQLKIFDVAGNLVVDNLAALIVAPGPALGGQDRARATPGDPEFRECGDNYDARNFLDPYDSAQAIGGRVNNFPGTPGNRVASDAADKEFVLANNAHYNDSFVVITPDEIFDRMIRRRDFAVAVGNLLDDPGLRNQVTTMTVSSGPGKEKGTYYLDCSLASHQDTQDFCSNWKEMLFLTSLPALAQITVDGQPTPPCARILIFGGRRTAVQSRRTAADKSDPRNYLEGNNLLSFAVPVAMGPSFAGWSQFSHNNPERDLVRCLP